MANPTTNPATPADHWSQVWAAHASYRSSWADTYARTLELAFIEHHLLDLLPSNIVEIGCGPFTLSERPVIDLHVSRSDYLGLDNSDAALSYARSISKNKFQYWDLNNAPEFPGLIDDDSLVICRRTLINLKRPNRFAVIKHILRFPHAIIIETPASSMKRLNAFRGKRGLSAIYQRPFNCWLMPAEEHLLDIGGDRDWFMGHYFQQTRLQDLSGYDTDYHEQAYHEQLADKFHTCPYGLAGWYW